MVESKQNRITSYEDLLEIEYKRSLLLFFRKDFKSEESNRKILDLIKRIEDSEKGKRDTEKKFYKEANTSDRISRAEIRSNDGVVNISIEYVPEHYASVYSDFTVSGSIQKRLRFNSKSEADKEEYDGLACILQSGV